MRNFLVVCGIVMCPAVALAAGVDIKPVSRVNPQVVTKPSSPQPLSNAALQSLAGNITREEQLKAVKSDPVMGKLLRKLQVGTRTYPTYTDPWGKGITLTPLAPMYPKAAEYGTFQLRLTSHSTVLDPPGRPLPHAGQNPPLLELDLWGEGDNRLITIEARWPQPGAYLVTFFVRSREVSDPAAKPRVRVDNETLTPAPNTPTNGDRWTILLAVGEVDPTKLATLSLLSSQPGSGFSRCCLSKVVISRLY